MLSLGDRLIGCPWLHPKAAPMAKRQVYVTLFSLSLWCRTQEASSLEIILQATPCPQVHS